VTDLFRYGLLILKMGLIKEVRVDSTVKLVEKYIDVPYVINDDREMAIIYS
jgi:hypothetical protein